MAEIEQAELTTLTVELLSAFVSNNTIESADLAGLIQSTHAALSGINAPPPAEPVTPEFAPAVTVRKSLGSRDHILSLIDGKPYKTLKRHLSGHGLTPAEYRERYKLPADYPMVAPTYSERRRDVAQRLGLGQKSIKTAKPETVAAEEVAVPMPDATVAVAPPAATAKQAKTKTVTPAKKPPKADVVRAATAATPTAPVPDAAAATDPVKSAVAPAAHTPKFAKAAAAPKIKATKAAAPKAKRAVSAGSQTEQATAPAKRGRLKANKTPDPGE